MKGFTIPKKKNPFQKHKEQEEERKRKADAEAARVYEEFVQSFADEEPPPRSRDDDDSRGGPGVKAFVHGGVVAPGSRPDHAPSTAGRQPGGKYVPSYVPPSFTNNAPPSSSRDRDRRSSRHDRSPDRPMDRERPRGAFSDSDDEAPAPAPAKKEIKDDESVFQLPSSKKSDKDKTRNIDKMLEELKREQEAREERARLRKAGMLDPEEDRLDNMHLVGSFDDGDPTTTNVYVGNLAPDVEEGVLMREFGRFGAIGSVKIMWPRDEEQRQRQRNSGFVAFMRREDADLAIRKLNGLVLHEYEMKLGWGKSVPLPPAPIYDGSQGAANAVPSVLTKPGAPGAAPAYKPPGAGHRPWGSGFGPARQDDGGAGETGRGADVEVKVPEDARLRFIIDSMAVFVLRDGCPFEQLMMMEQQGNPEYSFLFDLGAPEHAYYRWRLYSLAEGDSLRTWRLKPFLMVEGGQRWIPPSMTHAEAVVRTAHTGGRSLSDLERDKFENMLRSITAERAAICEAMVFALDNADAANDVVDILRESLTLDETPAALKVARLFLANDILHNSTAPVRGASRYRVRLEAALPDVFESLQAAYRTAEGRMVQEALRRHVLRVLRVWRERFIFVDDYLNGLQATFLRGPPPAEGSDAANALLAANAALVAELEGLGDEELERRCRHSGLASSGGKAKCILRLLALDDYLHAESRGGSAMAQLPIAAQPGRPVLSSSGGSWGSAAAAAAPAAGVKLAAGVESIFGDAAAGSDESDGDEKGAGGAVAAPAPLSRWEEVDEEAERQQAPQVPISKWLQVEQQDAAKQAQAEQQAAAAREAAAQRAIDQQAILSAAAAAAASISGRVEAGAAGAHHEPMDEERRAKLRKIEVEVMLLREQLEDEGLPKDQVDARAAQHRSQLMAQLDSSAAAGAGGPASAAAPRQHAKESGRGSSDDRGAGEPSTSRKPERHGNGTESTAADTNGPALRRPSPSRKRRSSRSPSPGRERRARSSSRERRASPSNKRHADANKERSPSPKRRWRSPSNERRRSSSRGRRSSPAKRASPSRHTSPPKRSSPARRASPAKARRRSSSRERRRSGSRERRRSSSRERRRSSSRERQRRDRSKEHSKPGSRQSSPERSRRDERRDSREGRGMDRQASDSAAAAGSSRQARDSKGRDAATERKRSRSASPSRVLLERGSGRRGKSRSRSRSRGRERSGRGSERRSSRSRSGSRDRAGSGRDSKRHRR